MGKTEIDLTGKSSVEKHPHGRGENRRTKREPPTTWETPPRTWGKPENEKRTTNNLGNTPTDVGKTVKKYVDHIHNKKHPHGRGENMRTVSAQARAAETPPRTWGKLVQVPVYLRVVRNTPTDVGKT